MNYLLHRTSAVVPSGATSITENGMTFHLVAGDQLTGAGLLWKNSATGSSAKTETLSESDDHYIVYTPSESGRLEIRFRVDAYNSSRKPTMVLKAADAAAECVNSDGDVKVSVAAADTEYVLSADLERGVMYYIWTYSYNWGGGKFYHNYTIPAITYTRAPTANGHAGILFRAR